MGQDLLSVAESMPLLKKDQEKPKIFPWDQSATRQFNQEELLRLRNEHPDDIAEALWPPGRFVQTVALEELVTHGNLRKAALVARRLVENHPICEQSLKKDIGEENYRFLMDTPILKLPPF